MPLTNKKSFFRDIVLEVCQDVYEPAEDSFLFAENLKVSECSTVLDMGTGTGLLGILAAKTAAEVLAVDVSPFAIVCAKKNSATNGVTDKMDFIQGDLFSSLRQQKNFDFILFNSPYLPSELGETNSWIGRAWAGGETGRQVIDKFISSAPTHLENAGHIFLLQSSLSNVEETVKRFAALNFSTSVVASLTLPFFESLVLLDFERK